jgi:glycosyltransferase involved in cell wall biosynthesis
MFPENFRHRKSHPILLVGMVNSPHFQRWILGVASSKTTNELIVFPSDRYPKIPPFYDQFSGDFSVKVVKSLIPQRLFYYLSYLMDFFLGSYWRSRYLKFVIRRYSPRIIHFHEMQHGAYLFNPIETKIKNPAFLRIVSTWGSDLNIYSRIGRSLSTEGLVNTDHTEEIKQVLGWTDILTAERYSESVDAARLGYTGKFVAPVYITVGIKNEELEGSIEPPSSRSQIIIKGYQHDAGRALNALEAIRRICEKLFEYEVVIYSAAESVRIQAELISFETGIRIRVLPRVNQGEILKEFSKSRIYIGLSISDGLSTSMVEAMSMGCFPIQSEHSAAGLFLQDGISGFIVNPWAIAEIAEKICIALEDDHLVDKGASINIESLKSKYDYEIGVEAIKKLYLSEG